MFYICPINQKGIETFTFPVYENLKTSQKAKLQIFILGGRNLDFKGKIDDFNLTVDVLQEHEKIEDEKDKKDKKKKM